MSARHAIATIAAIDRHNHLGQVAAELIQVTTPSMSRYAQRIGADFIVINNTVATPHLGADIRYEKFQLYDLLRVYDRVMLLDLDTVIYKAAPDIFEVVDQIHLGMLPVPDIKSEQMLAKYFDGEARFKWGSVYYNSGVMVASRSHQKLFEYRSGEDSMRTGMLAEQNSLNYRIYKYGIPVQHLDPSWHYIPRCIAKWPGFTGDIYIKHWAGGGRNTEEALHKLEIIRADIQDLEQQGLV